MSLLGDWEKIRDRRGWLKARSPPRCKPVVAIRRSLHTEGLQMEAARGDRLRKPGWAGGERKKRSFGNALMPLDECYGEETKIWAATSCSSAQGAEPETLRLRSILKKSAFN